MKKTVHYKPSYTDIIQVGHDAYVQPVDHPSPDVINKRTVRTTEVIRKEDDGTFETQNTIYVPL